MPKRDSRPLAIPDAPMEHVEYKEGLPVIGGADFQRLYNTDIRALGAGSAATFDFRGWLREDREGYGTGTSYKDVMATNGLLKDEKQPGIHVGTDGVIDYSEGARRMTSPDQVGEYDVYIEVPGALQERLGVVVTNDTCYSAEAYKHDYGKDDEEIASARGVNDMMVLRLGIDPKEDPDARAKVQMIHRAIVAHIESGRPLTEIPDLVTGLEDGMGESAGKAWRQQLAALRENAPKAAAKEASEVSKARAALESADPDEARLTERVRAARHFGELLEIIDEIGEIESLGRTFSPAEYKAWMREAEAKGDPATITRKYGLREKARELMRSHLEHRLKAIRAEKERNRPWWKKLFGKE